MVRCTFLSCLALLALAAFAGDAMVPEVTRIEGASNILFSFGGGDDATSFVARSAEHEDKRATRPAPSERISEFKLALVANTDEKGMITDFSLVSWKPADKPAEKAADAEWPQLKPIEGAEARIRGSSTLLVRKLTATAKDAKWSLEIISFRRMEPGEKDEDPVARAKKETIEEGGARLIEDRRFTLVAPAMPTDKTCYGILLTPVWKEPGKTLDGFDAKLVSTPAARAEKME